MGAQNDTPFLLQFIFGEAAALARQGASERLLRWCQAMDDWLAERQRVNVDRTYKESINAWKRLLSQYPKPPGEITPADIRQHMDWLQAQGYASSSITGELSILSRFYVWCDQHHVDPACGQGFNPLAEVPRPKVVGYAKAKVLSRAEVRALLAILKRDQSNLGRRDYAFFLARLMLGVKLKTLQHLQWGQIEQDQAGTWLRWRADKAPAPCPPEVSDALHAYLKASGRMHSIRPHDYIFAPLRDALKRELNGQPQAWNEARCLTNEPIRDSLKLYGKLAGIPEEKLTLQALRHTAVLLRQEAGDSLEQLQAFLGTNAQPKATKDYLRQLPPLPRDEYLPADEERPREKLHPRDGTLEPPLPVRKPRISRPGENLTHGLYAQKQPPEELQAVLAEDIAGMQDEFVGLRILSRKLLEALNQAEISDEVARLGDAYTLAADRLRKLTLTAQQLDAPDEKDEALEEILARVDSVSAQNEVAADDNGELPSEEFRRTAAQDDLEMQAGSTRLTEEIASTRLVLRRLYDQAMETQDVKVLVRYTNLYSISCTRLARLLRAEKGVRSQRADSLKEIFDKVILEVNKEFGLDLGS